MPTTKRNRPAARPATASELLSQGVYDAGIAAGQTPDRAAANAARYAARPAASKPAGSSSSKASATAILALGAHMGGVLKPETLTDKIRASIRKSLIEEFEEFMEVSSPEEQRFLADVFQTCASNRLGQTDIFIAQAFEIELGMLCAVDHKAGE